MRVETFPPRMAFALLGILLAGFLVYGVLRSVAKPYAYSDFSTFYSAAKSFSDHENPYDFDQLQMQGSEDFSGWIGRYFYPPPFAGVVLRPMTWIPFSVARRLWVLIEVAAYLLALVLLADLIGSRKSPWTLCGIGALGLPFAPIYLDLKLGSVSGLLLVLLVLFLRAHRQQRLTLAAFNLAAAIVLKLSPALLLIAFVIRKEWTLLWRTSAWVVLILVACLPLTGVQAYLSYGHDLLPELMHGNFSWFTNQSIDSLFTRLFLLNPDTTPWMHSPMLYRLGSIASSGLVLMLWARRLRQRPDGADLHESQWMFALTLIVALLVARVTWEYMCVLTLPAFALWLREWVQGTPTKPTMFWISCAFAAIALPIPYTQEPIRSGAGLLLESPRLAGMLILFMMTVLHHPQARPERRGAK